jgi:hypothetical protein
VKKQEQTIIYIPDEKNYSLLAFCVLNPKAGRGREQTSVYCPNFDM